MFSLLKDWCDKFPLYISSLRRSVSYRLFPYWKPHNSARMKPILACLLVLAVSLPLSNASCFLQPLKSETADGCQDWKGELHEFDSRWRTSDCLDCSCSKSGINCCTSFATPVGYDEEKCIKVFNKENCTYKVLEKDDYSKECPVSGWVG